MQDVSNLRQVLAQTHAVQRQQENARRRGEVEQQAKTRELRDKVDIRGRHVEETREPDGARIDPDAGREQPSSSKHHDARERQRQQESKKEPPPVDDEEHTVDLRENSNASALDEDGKGARLDLTEDGTHAAAGGGGPGRTDDEDDGKGSVIDVTA